MEHTMGKFARRNVFDLTHEKKLTCNMGSLIPILCEDVLPGDTFKLSTSMLVRLNPLLAPVMHRITAFTHFFFVPNRLIWTDFQDFITGGVDGNSAPVAPYKLKETISTGSIWDYFGVANVDSSNPGLEISALPLRAYQLIYQEWFRDQNLVGKPAISLASGKDQTTTEDIQTRSWEKDYFTSALPWTQRGSAVQMPLGSTAPVSVSDAQEILTVYTDETGTPRPAAKIAGTSPAPVYAEGGDGQQHYLQTRHTGRTLTGTADLSSATGVTINELRAAIQTQRWLEANARAGSRYVENTLAHFGVRSSDARIQRPEFLGGGRSPIVINEVLQTSATAEDGTPLAQMAGHALSVHKSHEFTKSFEEHGWIIGILSIMPRTAYQQGVPRRFSRTSRYDYYWPEFAHLGEQAILQKEIYAKSDTPDAVFGYAPRYEEYRRRESSVHDTFKSTLDFWHMGRKFETEPHLNSSFVIADPTKRIFAVEDETAHNCIVQLVNQIQAIRPIPLTGEPGLMDHV